MVLFIRKRRTGVTTAAARIGHAGRGIVSKISEGESTNIVVKIGLRSLTRKPIISSFYGSSSPVVSGNISTVIDGDYCFLGACQLCKKAFCPDKDVYMYRGDQGFCSIECRNRQIMIDEVKDVEADTGKRVATSSLDCRGSETCKLLGELRLRRSHRTKQHQPILSIS